MSLGYIPHVERLPLPTRRSLPWASAPWANRPATNTAARPVRRGVVLDLDDTLYPREQFVHSGFAAVAHHVSVAHRVPADAALQVLTHARADGQRDHELQALCDRYGLSYDEVPALLEVFRRHMPRIWLHHDAARVLKRLRVEGWRLGILTNGLPSVQFRKVAALGLNALVDEVVYAEEHAAGGKPAPAAFRAALRSLDLDTKHCIHVGDDVSKDVHGARAVGLRTIRLARHGSATASDDADIVIDSLAQLPAAAALMLNMVTTDVV